MSNLSAWVDPLEWCGNEYYRGSKPGEPVSFHPKPNEYKIDNFTGMVKTTHGVSVFDNAASVSGKGFTPSQIDMSTVNDTLKIIQRGADPRHYEIVPASPMPLDDYIAALSQIKVF